jgi:hypothetical protein
MKFYSGAREGKATFRFTQDRLNVTPLQISLLGFAST